MSPTRALPAPVPGLSEDETRQLMALAPERIECYLEATGWRRTSSVEEGRFSSWDTPEGKDFRPPLDILLPRNAGLADYPLRLREAITAMGRVQDKSQADVARALIATLALEG